ncbi:hypothetical protein F6V30_01980 [Oryzomonas sagensis]|uniref:Glycosyl hydrolase family 32 N-terminal domain-containing protein n=1 Tax=Oryzomonas sagensis TaxID=2603857 RepID=A0ABQ6TQV0_9BACT|nr:hypothetical protein [Oryzomonas sagensis]KAB0671375.1 hypothetical protein F6V30_01980 [Oryzomonas sagensis]
MLQKFFYVLILCCCSACGNADSQSSTPFEDVKFAEDKMSPILVPGSAGAWNELKADTGDSLLFKDSKWWLYHSGQNSSATNLIGLHISDGLSLEGPWNDLPNNPILGLGSPGDWDENGVAHPSVIERSGQIMMYYSGFGLEGEQIGLANSTDGVSFTKFSGNPVVKLGGMGEWDSGGVDHPSIIHDGKQYVMAYRGWASGTTDIHSSIGIATSYDGINWTKNPSNPVLRPGPPGSWDDYGVLAPRLWFDSGVYNMNYSGKPNNTLLSSIGHAQATSLASWVKSNKNPIIYAGDYSWHELEWGTNVKIGNDWFMLTTAWYNDGRTVLWVGKFS